MGGEEPRLKQARPSLVFVLALVAFVSLGLPDTVLGVAWPSIRRTFGLPLDRLGLLLFATMAGYLTSSFLSGPIVRRVGVGGLLVGSSAVVVASAVGYATSPRWGFVVLSGVPAGLGAGAIDASINAYAAVRFPPGRVAWLHACWGIGATLGPLLMTGVLATGLSWRFGYAALAGILSCLGLGFYGTRRLWETGGAPSGSIHPPARLGESLRHPRVQANVALFFAYTGIEATAGQWAFSLFTESRGVPRTWAGVGVGAYWASLTLGRLVFGALAHRYSPARLLRGSVALVPVFALLIASNRHPLVGFAGLSLLGFAGGPIFPLLIAGTPLRTGGGHADNAVGFQIAAACLGSAALPALGGVLARAYGIEAIAGFLLASALGVLALHEAVLVGERVAAPVPPREVLLSQSSANTRTPSTED
jgi:fucose permease